MKKKYFIPAVLFFLISFFVVAYLLFTGPHMEIQQSVKTYEMNMPLPPPKSFPVEKLISNPDSVNYLAFNNFNFMAGKKYYIYYCVFCHGEKGKGDGPVGKSYYPKPADLTNQLITSYSNNEIIRKMLNGMGHEPVLKKIIPPEYHPYIALYIKHLNDN